MNDFTPSPYQQRIFDWCEDGQGHAVVNAVAGSGKSTTLLAAAQRFAAKQHSVIFVAFSNHVVAHAQKQLSSESNGASINVSTIHKIGRACLARYLGSKLRPVEQWKYENLCRTWISENAHNIPAAQRQLWSRALARLSALTRQTLTDPTQEAGLQALMVRFDVDVPSQLLSGVRAILAEGESQAKKGFIDFTDMLYLPVRWKLKPPQYNYVLADETQDFNLVQLELIAQLVASQGRFIGAGDPRQAIMGFSGADDQAFYRVRDRFEANEFSLPTCYRCPTSHIALVQHIVPEIQAPPNADAGTLRYAREEEFLDLVRDGDLILHRLTAPLIHKCIRLIERGFAARIRGIEIADKLIDLAQQISLMPAFRMAGFISHLHQYELEQLVALNGQDDDQSRRERFIDHCAALKACYQRFQSSAIESLQESIRGLFSDKTASVYLSTIHSAKGLEAERVLLLDYNDLPMQWPGQKPWQLTQEENLLYVALTRSKRDLVIFGSPRLSPVEAEIPETERLSADPCYLQLMNEPLLARGVRHTLKKLDPDGPVTESLSALLQCLATLSIQHIQLYKAYSHLRLTGNRR